MKKIFLSLVITGFASTVSAQQNSFLDLQLQKRKKETVTTVKPLSQNSIFQKKLSDFRSAPTVNQGTLSHVLPDGDKVYSLPQDNMPCIVSDMRRFNSGSVYGKGEVTLTDKIGSIPNGAREPKTISR